MPASAKYLGELKTGFGNLGLAAAAYNAGESRVSRWLSSGGFLPLETENYVLDIMGEPADSFTDATYAGTIQPLDPKLKFGDACRKLPDAGIDGRRHGDGQRQAVGHPGRRQLPPQPPRIRQWQRVQGRYPRAACRTTSRWSAGCARRSGRAASMQSGSASTTAPDANIICRQSARRRRRLRRGQEPVRQVIKFGRRA